MDINSEPEVCVQMSVRLEEASRTHRLVLEAKLYPLFNDKRILLKNVKYIPDQARSF